MPKLNPLQFKLGPVVDRLYKVPCGGDTVELHVKRLSFMESQEIAGRAQSVFEAQAMDGQAAGHLHRDGGGVVEVKKSLGPWLVVSVVAAAQVSPEEDRYTAEELLVLMQFDEVGVAILDAHQWINPQAGAAPFTVTDGVLSKLTT